MFLYDEVLPIQNELQNVYKGEENLCFFAVKIPMYFKNQTNRSRTNSI